MWCQNDVIQLLLKIEVLMRGWHRKDTIGSNCASLKVESEIHWNVFVVVFGLVFPWQFLHDNKNIWYQLNIVRYVQYKDRLWKHINIICLLLLCPDCCSSWELSEGGSDDTKLRTQMWKMCYFPSCQSAKRILKPGFSVFAFIRDSRFYFLD